MGATIMQYLILAACCFLLAPSTVFADFVASKASLNAAVIEAAESPACRNIQPYYWEIGNSKGVLLAGAQGADAPTLQTVMPIASATKWIFAAYVVQKRQGQLLPADVEALTMQSGYTSLNLLRCLRLLPARRASQTVADCLQSGDNAEFTPQHRGKYFYNGGHFQHFAAENLRLHALNNAALASEVQQGLGLDIALEYDSPQLAGGIRTSAADYAKFLRAILSGKLLIGQQLGAHAVCTNVTHCAQALYTPVPDKWQWQYSLGHWVESDPKTGDGAFSSPGAFGFYPWIDATKQVYGIIARRQKGKHVAFASVECGQKLRQAFLGGERF